MNANDMLDVIGDAKGTYVWDAQQVRTGETDTRVRKLPAKKMWLIAAIVALLLVLAGCTVVYLLHMQDLKLGEHTVISTQQNSSESTERELDVLSLQGIQNSSNYLANQEWLAFTQSYEPELREYWESDEQYWAYNVQNQVMVDKLDEICGKYGLNVIGRPWHEHVDCNEFLPLIGVNALLRTESNAIIHIPQGRFFPGGSFTVYGTVKLSDKEHALDLTYHCVHKDVFYDVFAYVDPSTVWERNYTTAGGTPVLLLESEKSGMIMVDREDGFISIDVALVDGISLEAIADQFDFTIQSSAPDASAADAREQASMDAFYGDIDRDRFRRPTYGEYIEDILAAERNQLVMGFASSEIARREYTFYDLDGNGEQELLIVINGNICTVVGWKDGKTDEGKTYNMILCEDNVLIDKTQLLVDECWYHIFRFSNNGDTVFSNPKEQSIVRLKEVNGSWWRTSSTDHYADFDTQITEAEAMEILNSYVPVTLDTNPLTEFEEP